MKLDSPRDAGAAPATAAQKAVLLGIQLPRDP